MALTTYWRGKNRLYIFFKTLKSQIFCCVQWNPFLNDTNSRKQIFWLVDTVYRNSLLLVNSSSHNLYQKDLLWLSCCYQPPSSTNSPPTNPTRRHPIPQCRAAQEFTLLSLSWHAWGVLCSHSMLLLCPLPQALWNELLITLLSNVISSHPFVTRALKAIAYPSSFQSKAQISRS